MQNWAHFVAAQYKPYQKIDIDESWVRTTYFQFKLADLEFVLQDALIKYSSMYYSPIKFSCGLKEVISGYIDTDKGNLHEILHWACEGFIVRA